MLDPKDAAWELLTFAIADPAVPLVHADQNAPRPAPPFATLDIMAERPIADDVLGELDDDGAGTRYAQSAATAAVTFFGRGSYARAKALWLRLSSARVVEKAELLGMGIGRRLAMRDETALVDAVQREERAACEFEILWLASVPDAPGLIASATIEARVSGAVAVPGFVQTIEIEEG